MPSLGDALFFIVLAAVIASACGVAFSRDMLRSTACLLGTLLGVGALFLFLSAGWLAVAQVLLGLCGVGGLLVFAVARTHRAEANASRGRFGGAVLLLGMGGLFLALGAQLDWGAAVSGAGGPPPVGRWGVLFAVVAVLCGAALVGGVVVARKDPLP